VALYYRPPTLVNPRIVNIPPTGGADSASVVWSLDSDQDGIFYLPTDVPRTESVQIIGGRNIRVIGGEIDMATALLTHDRALQLEVEGHAFVEGVRIKVAHATKHFDAIIRRYRDGGGSDSIVTLQNVYATGMSGEVSGVHGDFFQNQHASGDLNLDELRIERCVAWTSYNVIVAGNVNRAHLRDFEAHKEDGTGFEANGMFAVSDSAEVTCQNVWFDALMDQSGTRQMCRDLTPQDIAVLAVQNAVVQPTIAQGSVQSGTHVTMPTIDGFAGHIRLGVPTGGSTVSGAAGLVNPSEIGLNYQSPWPVEEVEEMGTARNKAFFDNEFADEGKRNRDRAILEDLVETFFAGLVNEQVGTSYSIVASDLNQVIRGDNASAQTYTIIDDEFSAGAVFNVRQGGDGQITIAIDSGSIQSSYGTFTTRNKGSEITCYKVATGEWEVSGDLLVPSFRASVGTGDKSNVTGSGTVYTVEFEIVKHNHGDFFSNDTTFTAPVTGSYAFQAVIAAEGFTGAADEIRLAIVPSVGNESVASFTQTDALTGREVVNCSCVLPLSAGDTVTVRYEVDGEATDVIDVQGAAGSTLSWFSGHLVA